MQNCDQDLTASITLDVMHVLGKLSFYQTLDDALSPKDETTAPARCEANYSLSMAILKAADVDSSDSADIFCVLQAQGGGCDCEILHNVWETSRLKQRYWKKGSQDREAYKGHGLDIAIEYDSNGFTHATSAIFICQPPERCKCLIPN